MGGMGRPEGMTPPEGMERPEGEPPEGMTPPEGFGNGMDQETGEMTTEFVITDGGNMFSRVCEADSVTEV